MSVSGLELTHKDAFWYDLFQSRSVFFSRTTYSGAQLIQVHLFWGPFIPEFLLRNVWDIENDLFWDDLFWDDLFRDVLFGDNLFGWLLSSLPPCWTIRATSSIQNNCSCLSGSLYAHLWGLTVTKWTFLDDLDNSFGQFLWPVFRTIFSSVFGLFWTTFLGKTLGKNIAGQLIQAHNLFWYNLFGDHLFQNSY